MLGARRDATANAESTRGMLITILGEFVVPADGSAWTQTLVEALGMVGSHDKASRQAIDRLHKRGWLARERIGRRSRITITPLAKNLLVEGADRIYRFGQRIDDWDQQWVLLLASVPETQRNLRYRLTAGLTWAGFGSLGQGTWISPRSESESEAFHIMTELGIEATASFTGTLGELGDPGSLARRAWDLDEIASEYHQFLANEVDPAPGSRSEAATRLTELVHRWRRFPFVDPDLPSQMLPRDWPGATAANRFAELRDRLRSPARQWWSATEEHFGSEA